MADKFIRETYKDDEEVVALDNKYKTLGGQKPTLSEDFNKNMSLSKELLDKYNNMEFSYDVNGDALYQQYKNQYMQQGNLAMQDTIAQASAMTGGYGNSYAATAGNQAFQGSLAKLNDVIPELYQLAYGKFADEKAGALSLAEIYQGKANDIYAMHRDDVADWESELARTADERDSLRNFNYGVWSDNENTRYTQYLNELEQERIAEENRIAKISAQAQLQDSKGTKYASMLKNVAAGDYEAAYLDLASITSGLDTKEADKIFEYVATSMPELYNYIMGDEKEWWEEKLLSEEDFEKHKNRSNYRKYKDYNDYYESMRRKYSGE